MKIRHNIRREGSVLSGHILETIFEEGEERGYPSHFSKDREFSICSAYIPDLIRDILFVWGENKRYDNDEVSYTYNSPEEAQQALDYINEFTVDEFQKELEEGVERSKQKPLSEMINIGKKTPQEVIEEIIKEKDEFYHNHEYTDGLREALDRINKEC